MYFAQHVAYDTLTWLTFGRIIEMNGLIIIAKVTCSTDNEVSIKYAQNKINI